MAAVDGVQNRHVAWLHDGQRMVTVSDDGGNQHLVVHSLKDTGKKIALRKLDIGTPHGIFPSPVDDNLIVLNHRGEVLLVDLKKKTSRVLDTAEAYRVYSASWSP